MMRMFFNSDNYGDSEIEFEMIFYKKLLYQLGLVLFSIWSSLFNIIVFTKVNDMHPEDKKAEKMEVTVD